MKLQSLIKTLLTLSLVAIWLYIALPSNKVEAQFSKGQPFSAQVAFVAGDATKVIVAAPGAAGTLFVTYLACTITTTAAQTVDFDNGSTVDLIKLGASPAVNIMQEIGPMVIGISLGANTPLQYTPAAAGNAGNCVAEGYVVRTGA